MPIVAFALALTAILLWSLLATLGARLAHLPPLLLVGLALTIGGLLSTPAWRKWRVPWRTFAVGMGGIFGYHFLYFMAFRYAPAVEANLLNYLWPLLIVLLSPYFLPGYRLRQGHLWGAASGFCGAGLIVLAGGGGNVVQNGLEMRLFGYTLMIAAAFIWAAYSLLTKRLPPFPTAAVGAFCLGSGLLSLLVYFVSSGATGPQGFTLTAHDWINLLLIGAGPMGAAFFAWDAALKRGDPRIIGALSYLTPLTSTLLLITLGGHSLTLLSGLAMLLIIIGAVLGARA